MWQSLGEPQLSRHHHRDQSNHITLCGSLITINSNYFNYSWQLLCEVWSGRAPLKVEADSNWREVFSSSPITVNCAKCVKKIEVNFTLYKILNIIFNNSWSLLNRFLYRLYDKWVLRFMGSYQVWILNFFGISRSVDSSFTCQ